MSATPASQPPAAVAAAEGTVTSRRDSHGRIIPDAPHTLRELRLNRGYTLAELAEASGIYEAKLSEIETGRRVATPDQVGALESIFDVTLHVRVLLVAA